MLNSDINSLLLVCEFWMFGDESESFFDDESLRSGEQADSVAWLLQMS